MPFDFDLRRDEYSQQPADARVELAPGKRTLTQTMPAGAVYRDAVAGATPSASTPTLVAEAGQGNGQPLPAPLRTKFESSLGADLGGVRVHTGAPSAAAATALGANAYAFGADIHFAAGTYDPSSPAGERLLAHEVAHTVQQGGAPTTPQTKLEVSTPGDASEREADHAADAMIAGQPTAVTSAATGVIARETPPGAGPGPVIPSTSNADLNAGMFTVAGAAPSFGGTVTAEKDNGKVRLTSPKISFDATVSLSPSANLGATDRVDVGPIQTMLSSSRIGIYREGGRRDGAIVAQQATSLGEMRDATGEIDKKGNLDQATVAPFYSQPQALSQGISSGTIHFADQPKANFPAAVGRGRLTETQGQDSFVTSVSAKKGSQLLHLQTFRWQLPWGMQLDDGVIQQDPAGKSTAQPIAEQAAKPEEGIAHDSNNIPILAAAGATHMDFPTQEAANAASTQELIRFLPTSTGDSRNFIVTALRSKNPMLHITLTVDKKNSSWGKDSIEMRVRSQAQVSRPRVSAGDGEQVAIMVSLNEVFTNLGAMTNGSAISIEAQDRSLIDGTTHRVDWPYPFDALSGQMGGRDGTYSLVANLH